MFLTTDSDDIFELKLVFKGQLLKFALMSIAVLMGEKGEASKQQRAMTRGVAIDCERVVYDPRGDDVPVCCSASAVVIVFVLPSVCSASLFEHGEYY